MVILISGSIPFLNLLCRLLPYKIVKLIYYSRLLQYPYKWIRIQQTSLRMLPPYKCFCTKKCTSAVELRLQIHTEFPIFQCLIEFRNNTLFMHQPFHIALIIIWNYLIIVSLYSLNCHIRFIVHRLNRLIYILNLIYTCIHMQLVYSVLHQWTQCFYIIKQMLLIKILFKHNLYESVPCNPTQNRISCSIFL